MSEHIRLEQAFGEKATGSVSPTFSHHDGATAGTEAHDEGTRKGERAEYESTLRFGEEVKGRACGLR